MRISSFAVVVATCAFSYAAHADLPSTVPIYGGDSLDSVAASLEHSVPPHDDLRDEAERRLQRDGDIGSLVVGSVSASLGATLLGGGIALAAASDWKATDCPACLPEVILLMSGVQLSVLALFVLTSYGGEHHEKHHARHVDELVRAMRHPSTAAAKAARSERLTVGWSFVAFGAALVASSVTLFAIGHQDGFDDGGRMGLAALNGLVGSWLTTIGTTELATKWTDELAVAPARGGAMISYERRW